MSAPKKVSARPKGPDYRGAVRGLLQLPGAVLAVVARFVRKQETREALAADSATITYHTPAIADAVHETALNEPRFAAVLDRALQVGPYGALLAAAVPFVMQLAANHGRIPAGPETGLLTREELFRLMEAQVQAARR